MENLTLVGTIIAGISIIYNILTKLKNANLTKELLELEDLLTKEKAFVKSYQNTNKLLSSQINILQDKLAIKTDMELVVEKIPTPKKSRVKKS